MPTLEPYPKAQALAGEPNPPGRPLAVHLPREVLEIIVSYAWSKPWRSGFSEYPGRWELYASLAGVSRLWFSVTHHVHLRNIYIENCRDFAVYRRHIEDHISRHKGDGETYRRTLFNLCTLTLVFDQPFCDADAQPESLRPAAVAALIPTCRHLNLEIVVGAADPATILSYYSTLSSLSLWPPSFGSRAYFRESAPYSSGPSNTFPKILYLELFDVPARWELEYFPNLKTLRLNVPFWLNLHLTCLPRGLKTIILGTDLCCIETKAVLDEQGVIRERTVFDMSGWNIGAALRDELWRPMLTGPRLEVQVRVDCSTDVELVG
ncbi:hypothetical protein GLOTRDRAFT_133267 [Gloeophyllum trabeum ATCC 11539]|uniref:Uncharacterized protein n=1 Tax=Gloeophyllum trabeum (strain ATCC 11539 / FP-39264 / Madison 617) TaxID=670483 RepID=S7RAX0_GLOTA|nr:uncharacterized protein GLOTRDRAFT_133267 [Gloeophyllum trabeum ATCC 11539]EPQ51405.1 hypothetical protein GLOTRDRAFT_133267 [Gloeophyllum trabeum ATCC 11539]